MLALAAEKTASSSGSSMPLPTPLPPPTLPPPPILPLLPPPALLPAPLVPPPPPPALGLDEDARDLRDLMTRGGWDEQRPPSSSVPMMKTVSLS